MLYRSETDRNGIYRFSVTNQKGVARIRAALFFSLEAPGMNPQGGKPPRSVYQLTQWYTNQKCDWLRVIYEDGIPVNPIKSIKPFNFMFFTLIPRHLLIKKKKILWLHLIGLIGIPYE